MTLTLFINYIVSRQTGPHSEINISSSSLIIISCNHLLHSLTCVCVFHQFRTCRQNQFNQFHFQILIFFFHVLCNIEVSYILRACISIEIACPISHHLCLSFTIKITRTSTILCVVFLFFFNPSSSLKLSTQKSNTT